MAESPTNKKNKILKRRRSILNDLLDRPYTEDELQEKYDIKRKTLKDDIAFLKNSGFDIPKHSKKNGGYCLSEEIKEDIRNKMGSKLLSQKNTMTEKLFSSDILKTIILLIMQNERNYIDLRQLCNKYRDFFMSEYDLEDWDTKEKNIKSNLKYNLENEKTGLISEGLVEKRVISSGTVYGVTKKSPMYIYLSESEIIDIICAIECFGSSYILKKELISVYHKLSKALNNVSDNPSLTEMVSIGNIVNRNPKISEQLSKLDDVAYDRYVIRIQYYDKDIKFKVGIVVYVADKDKLYMIGKHRNNKKLIIDLDAISGPIEVTEEVNDIYQDDYYIQIYEEMFSISVEPKEHVIVEFKNYGRIYDKFKKLQEERPNASIHFSADSKEGIYEDDIRGMSDFAKFLRRFGRGVKVIAPEKLKIEMKNSLCRLEQLYKEEHNYE